MQLNHFPNHLQKAITITDTVVRELPTVVPSFENRQLAGQGYPFDNLQKSLISTNTPIYILQTSEDGAWEFVITPFDATGWVKTKNIAAVNADLIKTWESKKYITPIIRHASVKNKGHQFFFLTRLGELYPFVQAGSTNDKILVAIKGADGKAILKKAEISKKDIKSWPIAATTKNIAHFANRFIKEPYGWGDLYGYRDCSSTTKDLFAAFAIWLLRHSGTQAHTGKWVSFRHLTDQQKQQKIIKAGIPFFTLIHSEGHIMLYIGVKDHQVYIFHSPWGLHTKNPKTHKPGRDIIGRTVITPLDLGGNLSGSVTRLTMVDGMTFLVPRKYLTSSRT